MEEYQATPIKEVKTENELKRTMGFFTALSTVMSTVIGAGVFFKAASVAEVTGTYSSCNSYRNNHRLGKIK